MIIGFVGFCFLVFWFLQVMNASSFEVSHYFQLIFKLILLAYAVLCLSQLLHRWSNGSSLLSLWCA